jgi:hypothetical protein
VFGKVGRGADGNGSGLQDPLHGYAPPVGRVFTHASSRRLRHVFIDPATKARKAMPGGVRRALEPYLAEAEEQAAAPA